MLNLVFSFDEKNADRIIEAFSLKDDIKTFRANEEEGYLHILSRYFTNLQRDLASPKLVIKNMGTVSYVEISRLRYVEVYKRIVVLHTDKEVFKTYASLKLMEKILKEMEFVRVQKSYLIAIGYIRHIKGNTIELDTGEVIPIGRKYKRELKEMIAREDHLGRVV